MKYSQTFIIPRLEWVHDRPLAQFPGNYTFERSCISGVLYSILVVKIDTWRLLSAQWSAQWSTLQTSLDAEIQICNYLIIHVNKIFEIFHAGQVQKYVNQLGN